MRLKSYKITTLIVACGFAFMAADVVGQVTMKFSSIKDIQLPAFAGEQLNNRGGREKIRPLRGLEDVSLMDFDTAAMGAFLAANPGTATWTLNVAPVNADDGGNDLPGVGSPEITMLTIESTNDWVEGVGTQNGPLNWDESVSPATYFYAQTAQSGGLLDTVNSLEWIDPDSGPYTFTPAFPGYGTLGVPTTVGGGGANSAGDPTPEFTNSVNWDWAELATARTNKEFASLAIDDDIIGAMINDVNNRGLRFGPLFYGEITSWRIWSRESSSSLEGDFDNDLDVDGDDFLKWQRDSAIGAFPDWQGNYGSSGGGSFGPYLEVTITQPLVSAVPEPSSLLLLMAVCLAKLSTTSRANRQTV